MNKVITINLGGNAWQLEEGGYDALRAYLETAAARLAGNPDRDEILSDIERAIAEKFRALLTGYKTVVETKEVETVIKQMGPIETDTSNEPGHAGAQSSAGCRKSSAEPPGGAPRRLYRIEEGAMWAGVCNGIAAYTGVDPTLVRLGFVLLTVFWGSGVLVYIVLAFVMPEASSPEEKAAASGTPFTAQEFIRRAKEGYYEAMRGFPDRNARRLWRCRFRREMRAHAGQWRYNWRNYWARRVAIHPAMSFYLPLLSLLQGLATILWVCALVSLFATGTLLGLVLPPGVPVWVAAILLFVVYGITVGPLKVARRICYWGMGEAKGSSPLVVFLDMLIWVVVAVALVLLSACYLPEVRHAIQSIPHLAHQAADSISAWWRRSKG